MTGMARASGQFFSPAGTEPWHGQCEDGNCPVGAPVAVDGVETKAPLAIKACGVRLQSFGLSKLTHTQFFCI